MARVSILGLFDNRTTRASACATSLDPFDATRTRSFWHSVTRISAIEEDEDAFGRLFMKRDCRECAWSAMVLGMLGVIHTVL